MSTSHNLGSRARCPHPSFASVWGTRSPSRVPDPVRKLARAFLAPCGVWCTFRRMLGRQLQPTIACAFSKRAPASRLSTRSRGTDERLQVHAWPSASVDLTRLSTLRPGGERATEAFSSSNAQAWPYLSRSVAAPRSTWLSSPDRASEPPRSLPPRGREAHGAFPIQSAFCRPGDLDRSRPFAGHVRIQSGSLQRTTHLRSRHLIRFHPGSLSFTRLRVPARLSSSENQRAACRLLQHNRPADTVRKLPVLFVLERARVSRAHARPDGPRWEVPIPAFADRRRPLIRRYVRAPFVACRRAPFREGNRRFPSGQGQGSHDSPRRRIVIAPDQVLSTREPGAPLGATRDPPAALRLTRSGIGAFVTTRPEPR